MPMPQRKPFIPPTSTVSGSGAGTPGMGMPPVPNGSGPQPTMPMGGAPGGQAAGAGNAMGGGPTSPFNIQQMLQTQAPPQTMGASAPSMPQPMTVGGPLPPWGDQGARAEGLSGGGQMGPKRMPVDLDGANKNGMGNAFGAGGAGMEFGQSGGNGGMDGGDVTSGEGPTVMMRLLRSLGRI